LVPEEIDLQVNGVRILHRSAKHRSEAVLPTEIFDGCRWLKPLLDALPRLEAVGFGGNATPSGINMRIALVGLTVRSRTRDCAQPLLSETLKVGRPLSATNSFETFTRWKTSWRNQCFTSQRTVHKLFENLERIASRFIPRLEQWAFSVSSCKTELDLVPVVDGEIPCIYEMGIPICR
jgi:hypothetical protein